MQMIVGGLVVATAGIVLPVLFLTGPARGRRVRVRRVGSLDGMAVVACAQSGAELNEKTTAPDGTW